jgi:ATP-dependent Clp protease protease subunit
MRPTKLLNLLASNAKRGSFRAEGNTIYLYDVIVASDADAQWFGGVSAESFVKALAGLSGEVALHINSPGGDVFAGVAMAQAIRAYPGKVTAHIDGLAASAASAVAVAADEAIMAPGSMLMIHNAWTIALGNRHDFLDTAALLEKIDGDLAQAYAKRSGGDVADYAAMMDKETWLTADETVELGLANAIAPEKTIENLAKFDLSAFEAAPAIQNDTVTVTVTVEVEDSDDAAEQAAAAHVVANEIEHRVRQLSARLLQHAA